jgi:hypothetical protein
MHVKIRLTKLRGASEPPTSEHSAAIGRLRTEMQTVAPSVYELVMNACHAPAWTCDAETAFVNNEQSSQLLTFLTSFICRSAVSQRRASPSNTGYEHTLHWRIARHFYQRLQKEHNCLSVRVCTWNGLLIAHAQVIMPRLIRPAIVEACHYSLDEIDTHAVVSSTGEQQ